MASGGSQLAAELSVGRIVGGVVGSIKEVAGGGGGRGVGDGKTGALHARLARVSAVTATIKGNKPLVRIEWFNLQGTFSIIITDMDAVAQVLCSEWYGFCGIRRDNLLAFAPPASIMI
jgi:hypothetical protein